MLIFVITGVKLGDMWLIWGRRWPKAAVTYHHLSDMIYGGAMKTSFVGLLHFLMIWGTRGCFVEVGGKILRAVAERRCR